MNKCQNCFNETDYNLKCGNCKSSNLKEIPNMEKFEIRIIHENNKSNTWKIIQRITKMSKEDVYYGFCGNCSFNFVNGLCPCRIENLNKKIKEIRQK